ncbi:MAG: hypothetical protein A2Y79_04980 [Deltaproteobacteria bacterium RBG_13_43_22]|nr:MAG: hypothetical protein A2Y79_04980 [Deltaproteobacteria bacterium RBG_13_43_22]
MINNRRKKVFLPIFSIGAFIILLVIVVGFNRILEDPRIHLLINEGGAEWIRFPEPFRLPVRWSEQLSTYFRYRFDVQMVPEKAVLNFRVMKNAVIYLDGSVLLRTTEGKWKEPHRFDISRWLSLGEHELIFEVSNFNGHPALIAYSEQLSIFSGSRWAASKDRREWYPALSVDRISPFSISLTFLRADRAIGSLSPLLLSIFVFFFFWSLRLNDHLPPSWMKKASLSAGSVRWIVLGGWLLLAFNNFWKIPLEMGMDFKGHMQYILHVAEHGRIPLATAGWQMFQPPLYYLVTSSIYQFIEPLFSAETVIRILKLFPFFCGLIQVELSYRTVRVAYPDREGMQVVGTLLGGLIPMNLYMSQSLGNEPLAGCLTAMLILLALRIISRVSIANRESAILMGFVLGLALLTKATPILIILPLLFFISSEILKGSATPGEGVRLTVRFIAIFLGIALTVSGWYYLRNYLEMGGLFIGGWDSSREIVWWQDPGYRTPRQFYTFGVSLFYPVFSSIFGFWDGIYSSFWSDAYLSAYTFSRPPWNYRFMLSGLWLSLFPSAAILIGFFSSFRKNHGPVVLLRFCTACITFYLVATFYLFLTVPIWSNAKASYALGLIPCFTLIGTEGFDLLTRQRFVRAVAYGLLACWAVASYVSYFAV